MAFRGFCIWTLHILLILKQHSGLKNIVRTPTLLLNISLSITSPWNQREIKGDELCNLCCKFKLDINCKPIHLIWLECCSRINKNIHPGTCSTWWNHAHHTKKNYEWEKEQLAIWHNKSRLLNKRANQQSVKSLLTTAAYSKLWLLHVIGYWSSLKNAGFSCHDLSV